MRKGHSIMKKNRFKDMVKVTRRLTVCCLMLWCFVGNAMAQNDNPVVIKMRQDVDPSEHYLAHVYNATTGQWELQDRTTFTPECIWYTGPEYNLTGNHHNYYFNDGVNNRFLCAPLQTGDVLSLSPSTPAPYLLQNTDQIYYFYDWDRDNLPTYGEGGGVARGRQYNVNESECTHTWYGGECWEAYYVAYINGKWQMSPESYNITTTAGRYRGVTITENTTVTSGGLGSLSDLVMYYGNHIDLSLVPGIPYKYTVHTNYRFYETLQSAVTDHIVNTPGETNTISGYQWSISGDAKNYLSFAENSDLNTTTDAAPTLYYRVNNPTGDKTATLTLVVTYGDGATQTRTATVTVKTVCQHPVQAAAPVVTFDDVTVSWYDVADSYVVKWRKQNTTTWSQSSSLSNVSSYTITGLDPITTYQYQVEATCGSSPASGNPTVYSFTTKDEPHSLVYGAIYGGGRMADVRGTTEIQIINCDSIGAIFGGNDIAGTVRGADGSSITLGTDATTSDFKIGSVYGGGNGYYAYNGTSFVAATDEYASQQVVPGGTVNAMTSQHQVGNAVYTNTGTEPITLSFPSITKTSITVANNYVRVDTIFGGAKNAFITLDEPDKDGSHITISKGTVYAVFGGNNWGGTQKRGKHHIEVSGTKTTSTATTGYGRDFGVGYLFGGGNKVLGSATDISITGGMIDTVFGGGNQATVTTVNLEVNCTGDHIITDAVSGGNLNANYAWNGTGVYNVRTLFGGNNRAPMNLVPNINLASGGIGTAYAGANAGKMQASKPGEFTFDGVDIAFNYSTKIQVSSPTVYVDNLYGGCQMSDVDYSTWVELTGGNVGTVYGGCNISGDVGSVRLNPTASSPSTAYQTVRGATFVHATGGTVHKNLFAGSNGYYHCNDGVKYIAGTNFDDPAEKYVGMRVPTHNETNVFMSTGTTVEGNVFAGGNLACVGFTDWTVPSEYNPYPVTSESLVYPQFVGLAAIHMNGGTVKGNVFGGGSMASVYGSNEVSVSGGTIQGALYGGNDKTGQVAQITNRIVSSVYDHASDGKTSLADAKTYVYVSGSPTISTVYGGGNGDYDYSTIQYCGFSPDKPIQSNTFVDIAINGGPDGGKIDAVYGGGNGVTAQGTITVFLNAQGDNLTYDNVKTIFGGNNKGELVNLVPDIILYKGRVKDVYGGCNSGAMTYDEGFAFNKVVALDANGDGTPEQTYDNVGSYVRLLNKYRRYNKDNTLYVDDVNVKISGNVYGGCRMNGVEKTSLVVVENRDYSSATLFGGSDISGTIEGTSRVVVAGTVGDVYGGGNGNYDYTSGTYANLTAPYSANSRVDMLSGTCIADKNLYAGGYAGLCGTTLMNMVNGTVNGSIFGGGNMAGTTTDHGKDGSSTVTVTGGSVLTGVYGGCNASGNISGDVAVNIKSNLGISGTPMTAGIYGGGYGKNTGTSGDVTVTIGQETTPTLYANVYGGSALGQVGANGKITKVDFKNGSLHGHLFGGGMGSAAIGDSAVVNGNVQVNVTNGTLYDHIYGGCNVRGGVTGDIVVNVNGGNLGTGTGSDAADVFGGGYGHSTSTSGNVEVNIDGASATVWGDVYGGSGLGDVNAFDDGKTTTVNILNGILKGDVYGGGLGDANNPAAVNGKVYVNIGAPIPQNGTTPIGNATILGSVYGCNNTNGSPQDEVFVNVYKTAHGTTPATNLYPSAPTGGWTVSSLATNADVQAYALGSVFGGGNRAAYTPVANKSTTVHVYYCDNTIEDLYGGGNAADVGVDGNGIKANTNVIIDGGRIGRVFGGGNGFSSAVPQNHTNPNAPGYNPGANIYGLATSTVYGGLVDEVYGGANSWGTIDEIQLNISSSGTCSDKVFGKVFGCANEAPLNHSITTTVECGAGDIGELYGGSNQAPIGTPEQPTADVTLNLYGGDYTKVFGGSKGNNTVAANIYGDVTLNLYGGTVVNAFGGSDVNGSISGVVTVNVLDLENNTCPLELTNVYGASNQTAYSPNNPSTIVSPVVNVMHIKEKTGKPGIMGNVFGGGNEGQVTANPKVNIGYDAATQSDLLTSLVPTTWTAPSDFPRAYIVGNVFGGGNKAAVVGTDTVNMRHTASRVTNLFGGGNEAGTTNAVVNFYEGTVASAIYGGCNSLGNVAGDIEVNVMNDLGTSSNNVNVFGGGLGQPTTTAGNVTVNFGGNNTTPVLYGTVYGGSALGSVGATGKLTKVHLQGGTIHGNVFGGGLGQVTPAVAAQVKGNIQVIGDGTNLTDTGKAIFGANDQNGNPEGTVTVTINSGEIINVVGGGNVAAYSAPAGNLDYPYINITGGTVSHKVIGGGNNANVTGNPRILIEGGTIANNGANDAGIFGGCNATGTVDGDVTVSLTGGTIGVSSTQPANIHGGGYGQSTSVSGNVTLTYGDDSNVHSDFPKVFGDIYGGSALGNVNTVSAGKTTTVNVLNGKVNGNVYGGGLGQKTGVNNATSNIEALVNGKVYVNIGKKNPDKSFVGQADLAGSSVFGCNNTNGTPKDDVFVNIYKTYMRETDSLEYDANDRTYAIYQVFGGGNNAHYKPLGDNKVTTTIDSCYNSIERVFGGGNAADLGFEPQRSDTTKLIDKVVIDGGRFDYIFAGGNGELDNTESNIWGCVDLTISGGSVGQFFGGSNRNGVTHGTSVINTEPGYCALEIDNFFCGGNFTDVHGDVETTITCGSDMHVKHLYGGCNLANIYGHVKLTIEGGEFIDVYGGSKGSNYVTPFIRDYIELNLKGGTIENAFGGCDVAGTVNNVYHNPSNVNNSIAVNVDDAEASGCGLVLHNVYGAADKTSYVGNPLINIKHGTVSKKADGTGGNVFGGGHKGNVTGNPSIYIGVKNDNTKSAVVEGSVYGGGDEADVTGTTNVVLQGNAEVDGNVYGGGHLGDVNGSANVTIVPED